MASRGSRGEIECSSQGLAELVGCSSAHYIQAIDGNSVRKILNVDSQRRPLPNYKPLTAVYAMEDANAAALQDRKKMKRGKLSCGGGMDVYLEQSYGHSKINKVGITDKNDSISSNKINDRESDSDCEGAVVDNMTLGELQTWCKSKRQKVMMSPSESDARSELVNESGMHGQPQNAEADLDEPLIILKHKVSKHAMPNRKQVKKGNISLSESSPSCLLSVENSRDLLCLDSVKVDCMTEDATVNRDSMEVAVHSSSHVIVPVSQSDALCGSSNEFPRNVKSEVSELYFPDQQNAVDIAEHPTAGFITKFHFDIEPSYDVSDNLVGSSQCEARVSADKDSDERASQISFPLLLPVPERKDPCECTSEPISVYRNNNECALDNHSEMKHVSNSIKESRFPDYQSFGSLEEASDAMLPSAETSPFSSTSIGNSVDEAHLQESYSCVAQGNIDVVSLEISEYTSFSLTSKSFPETTPQQTVEDGSPPADLDLLETMCEYSDETENQSASSTTYTRTDYCDARHTYIESECPEKVLYQGSAEDTQDHNVGNDINNVGNDITLDNQHANNLDDNCISCINSEISGLVCDEVYDEERILCNHDYNAPFHINECSVSGETIPVSSESSDSQPIDSTSPHSVDNNTTIAAKNCSSSSPEEIERSCTEATQPYPSMVINSNKEQPKEIDMHASHLCNGISRDSHSVDSVLLKTKENTRYSTVVDDEHFGARLCKMDASCIDSVGQKGIEIFESCPDKELRRPPKRFPSNRKVLSPTSKEKLFQTVDAEELYENMQVYRNRKRLWFDKWPESPSVSDCREPESVVTPEKIILKSKIDSGNICKGILKSSRIPYVKSSPCTENPLVSSHAQDAIKFSQRQMLDIESITAKLLTAVKSMKSIMEETLNLEEFSSAPLRSIAQKMIAAQENAASAEVTTEKYLSMMNRDFKRFCKIMRSKECCLAVTTNDAPKERKRITFADEAGGLLCHVKVFEEHPATVANDNNGAEGDSCLMQTVS